MTTGLRSGFFACVNVFESARIDVQGCHMALFYLTDPNEAVLSPLGVVEPPKWTIGRTCERLGAYMGHWVAYMVHGGRRGIRGSSSAGD